MFMPSASPPEWRRFAVFGDSVETGQGELYRRAARALKEAGIDPIILALQSPDGPLLEALAAQGFGRITVITAAEGDFGPLVEIVPVRDRVEARAQTIRRADALLGLPSGPGPVSDLYLCWADARRAGQVLPVGLLNQKRAFEVVRGFIGDVASVGIKRTNALIQFSDSIEDLIGQLRTMTAR